jgi:type IV secretory pathway VirB6-like protein
LSQFGYLLNALLVLGLIAYPLQNYSLFLGTINQGFDQVTSLISGGGSATTQAFAGFQKLIAMGLVVWNSVPNNIGMSWTDLWNLKDAAELVSTRWFDTAATALALLVMALAAVLYIGIYSYALVMFMVGAIMGPIMLPWYLLSPFRYIAEGWIKFMIHAGLQRVVAISLIAILNPFITQMTSTIQQQAASITSTADKLAVATNHMLFSFGVFLLGLLVLYILSKVPEITGGLLQGGSSGGFNIGGAASRLTRRTSTKPNEQKNEQKKEKK